MDGDYIKNWWIFEKIYEINIIVRPEKSKPNFSPNLYPFLAPSPCDSALNASSLLKESSEVFSPNLDILSPTLLFGLPASSWLLEELPCPSPSTLLSVRSAVSGEVGLHLAWHLRQTSTFRASMLRCGLWRGRVDAEAAGFDFPFLFSELWVCELLLEVLHIFPFHPRFLSYSVIFVLQSATVPFQVRF